MGSRLRTNPTRFVECWCEVVAPKGQNNPPWIVQKLPRSYGEEEVLKSVPQFTFPCAFEKSAVQHFSFVLTNLESKFLYGFCRHAPDSESAIVILSHLPWHELFYKMLNHCSSLIANENSGDLWSFLQSLYQLSVPAPGTKLSISYGDNKFFIAECPNHLILPSIPENRNLSEYFSAVDVENMMTIFAAMLNERRIIFTSERVSRLSACVQAANTLIYPMSWQHIFIPVLPEHLVDYLSAPMPFLIGIAWSLMQKVTIDEIGEVVILNADTNKVTSPFNDLQNLPEEVVSILRKNLNPSNNLLGDSVARAFLKALVHLIGNYREALQFREEDRKITFCEDKFIMQRPSHFQPFVQKMLELQIFRQFIEERVDLLNSGLHTSDEFELEAIVFGEKSSSKMKQIISNVKKESGAIMKNVKNKTNPAVKSAVKSVKSSGKNVREKSKITYKGIKGKLKDIQQGTGVPKSIEASRIVNGEAITKPRSAPSSPTQPFSQRRMNKKSVSGIYEGYSAKASYAKRSTNTFVQKTVTIEARSIQNQHSDEYQKTPSPQEIDLIGEMEDALKTQLIFTGPDLSPNKHSSLSSLSSFTHQDTVSNFSLSSSVISNNDANLNNAYVQNAIQNPLDGQCLENSKHLSASLTSLPLLDLSLDIPMPPPLFPQLSSSLPQTCCEPTSLPILFDHRKEDLSGNGQDNYSLACQKIPHFRSPKISTHFTDSCSIASNACQFNSPPSNHYVLGERRLENSRNRSSQDLLFMESPHEESFDPFFGQEISPPIPSRLSKNSNSVENARETGSLNVTETTLDLLADPDLQLPSNLPRKLSPTRYLPFNTLQTCPSNIPKVGLVQNPMYNPHQLPFIRPMQHPPPPPPHHSRPTNPFITDNNTQVGSLRSYNPLTEEFESSESYNPAVAFAASMLSNSSNLKSSHNFSQNPFISSAMNSRDKNIKFTDRDLLGDFSSEFQKLSVNAKDKNCNL